MGFRNGEEDVNHERISVPRVLALSQQHRTPFKYYERAWRTVNTGSEPAGNDGGNELRKFAVVVPGACLTEAETQIQIGVWIERCRHSNLDNPDGQARTIMVCVRELKR